MQRAGPTSPRPPCIGAREPLAVDGLQGQHVRVGTKWVTALVETDADGLERVARDARAFANKSLARRPKLSMLAAPAEAPGSRLWALGWSLGPPSKRIDSYDERPDLSAAFKGLTVGRRSTPIFERLRDELLADFPDFALAVLASAALGRAWFVGRLEIVGYQAFVEFRDGRVHDGTIVYRGDGPFVVRFERGRARVRQPDEDEELDPDDDGLASISGGAFSGVDDAIDAFYQHAYHVEWALRGPRARMAVRRFEHGSRDALAPPAPVSPPRGRAPRPRARPKLAPFASHRAEWSRIFWSDVTSYREIAGWKITGGADRELERGLLILYSREDPDLARRYFTRCIRAAKLDERPQRRANVSLYQARGLRARTLAAFILGRSSSPDALRAVATTYYTLVTQDAGVWSEFEEADYLVALRAALILGDVALYAAMPPRRKRLARHAKEQELLTRLANDPDDPHLARSFRSFLDVARKPSRLAEARVVELAALYDKYFVSRDGTIDWSRVVAHVVGGRPSITARARRGGRLTTKAPRGRSAAKRR